MRMEVGFVSWYFAEERVCEMGSRWRIGNTMRLADVGVMDVL